ncbi:AI-2E family transporter [Rossellomorea vietnamensis]|uniref:AI-2E family transporter n=1 Tax=Rossellomorea vietnamensis TaxID=218284 RepID=A0A5D4KIU6_9BACI|nr:AI-2E family transporter [Rossellomorea vietnamensis]TYR76770.1 AI-2E family transporter [Rossellomorea vietnamensis]
MNNRLYVRWLYRLAITLLAVITLYVFYLLQPVWKPVLSVVVIALIPFLLGGFITYLLHPVVEKLFKAGIHRGVAILLIYILFFGGLGYAVYKGIPVIIHQLKDLAENAPLYTDQYQRWLEYIQNKTSTWPDGIQHELESRIERFEAWLNGIVALLLSGVLKVMNSLLLFAIVPFISFYLLKDFPKVKRAATSLTPQKWRCSAGEFLKDLDESLGGYIRGQLLVCFLIGALATLSFWLFGMKYPLLLGLIVGITNVIPYFGPIIGAVPAAIVASTISTDMILKVVVVVLVLQFLEGNVLSPLIVGKSLHMHPLFIMGALIVGGEIGGVLGLIVAVPLLAMLRVAVIHARTHFSVKETP